MTTIIYDGTFEGFLSAVFEIYESKLFPQKCTNNAKYQPQIFDEVHNVVTNEANAKRVWNGLCKKLSKEGQKILYYTFLSENEGAEMLLLRFIHKVLAAKNNIEQNFGDRDVLEVWQIAKKVGREIQRIPMFVRFQKTRDGIFYASFDPQYNILHLATDHFKNRFADQKWILYDTTRNYGYYYDLNKITEISFTESTIDLKTGKLLEGTMANDELDFQRLWKIYYTEIAIKERINPRLQRQYMPRKFWKYLVEKWE
jgi:probable DNA metabolism protein